MTVPKIVIHTDVFLDHLCGIHQPSILRIAMSKFFCYTTVFQAVELFSIVRSPDEVRAVEDAMAAMKVMGMNPKNSRKYGEMLGRSKGLEGLHVMIAGLCLDSRLPILTNMRRQFRTIKGLVIVPTKLIKEDLSGA
ncbi:MAG: hypothetical protein HY708_06255, partial [Ignavibacteriae bacterium]|nr:hypothetical protein [Ignavibacteriota bacterium]